jgi:hypothetical protein
VGGGTGIDIAKGEHLVIFINNVRGNFSRGNFFEQSFAHAFFSDAERIRAREKSG